jgi:hypothetical protein
MFLIVFAASVTAFWAASLQLFGELPISSIILITVIQFTSITIVLLRALQLFDPIFVGHAIFEYQSEVFTKSLLGFVLDSVILGFVDSFVFF